MGEWVKTRCVLCAKDCKDMRKGAIMDNVQVQGREEGGGHGNGAGREGLRAHQTGPVPSAVWAAGTTTPVGGGDSSVRQQYETPGEASRHQFETLESNQGLRQHE